MYVCVQTKTISIMYAVREDVQGLVTAVYVCVCVQTKTISIMYAVREDVQGLVTAVYVCMYVYRRRQLA